MIRFKRLVSFTLVLILFVCSSSLAAKQKEDKNKDVIRKITTEVVEVVPETIQEVLDLAYEQLIEVNGKNLGKKNK